MHVEIKINIKKIEFNAKTTRSDEYRNEYRKYGRNDVNTQAGIVASTSHSCWEFPKTWKFEIANYMYYSFSGGFRKYSSRDTAGPYSLFISVSLCPPPSLILLGPADGFPHAHVPRGRPGEIMNETRTEKGETEYVSCPSYSRFRPALAQARAITSIIEGVGCRRFYYHH